MENKARGPSLHGDCYRVGVGVVVLGSRPNLFRVVFLPTFRVLVPVGHQELDMARRY